MWITKGSTQDMLPRSVMVPAVEPFPLHISLMMEYATNWGDSPVSSQRQVGYASFIVLSSAIFLREDELNRLPMRWWAIMIRGFLGILLGIAPFFMPVATLLAFLSVRGLCLL